MSDVGFHLAFWSLSAVTIGAALMVVVSRNLIHAVVCRPGGFWRGQGAADSWFWHL